MTGVTNAQIKRLGITDETPMHPEEELRNLGADFECVHGTSILLGDISATSTSVARIEDSNAIIVTGQNQCSACVAAQRQLQFFLERL